MRARGPEGGRGRAALLAGLLSASALGCAARAPVTPPPALSPERIERARTREPTWAAEIELLQWRALEHAHRGELEDAERFARLARSLLSTVEALPEPARCMERAVAGTRTATVAAAEANGPAPKEEKRRRRRRRAKPAPPPEAGAEAEAEAEEAAKPSPLEQRMQALALALRRVRETSLDADGRVWLDGAQRSLIEAQRALAASAPERARQHLDRVTDALAAVGGEVPEIPQIPESAEPNSGEPREEEPLLVFARDLATSGLEAERGGAWLALDLHAARTPGNVSRRQRERLQILGRLLRVYGGARTCVQADASLREEVSRPATEAVVRYLQGVEQIEPARFVVCPADGPGAEAFRRAREAEAAKLILIGVTFGARQRS